MLTTLNVLWKEGTIGSSTEGVADAYVESPLLRSCLTGFDIGRGQEKCSLATNQTLMSMQLSRLLTTLAQWLLAWIRTGIGSHTSSRPREPPPMTERPHIVAPSPYQAGEMLLWIQSFHLNAFGAQFSHVCRSTMAASPVPGNLTWRLCHVFSWNNLVLQLLIDTRTIVMLVNIGHL